MSPVVTGQLYTAKRVLPHVFDDQWRTTADAWVLDKPGKAGYGFARQWIVRTTRGAGSARTEKLDKLSFIKKV